MSSHDGESVYRRIRERCMHEMERTGCPFEVFVSSRDWRDLDEYFKTKAKYESVQPLFGTTGIKVYIDGNNQPVEIRDIGCIVLV